MATACNQIRDNGAPACLSLAPLSPSPRLPAACCCVCPALGPVRRSACLPHLSLPGVHYRAEAYSQDVPTPRWKGREGNIPTNGEHTSRGRAQGRTTTCYALIFLKRYHLFLGHLWSLPGQILVITRHSKHACLTIHIRPSVKEIRPVMSKSRLNKRK